MSNFNFTIMLIIYQINRIFYFSLTDKYIFAHYCYH